MSVSGYPVAAFVAAPEPRTQPRGAVTSDSWVTRLTRELPASGAKDEDAYRAELTRALIDHHVSCTEIRQLERTALAAGLSADDVDAINEEFTRQLVIEAWADGVITDEERQRLIDIAAALEVDVARISSLDVDAGKAECVLVDHAVDATVVGQLGARCLAEGTAVPHRDENVEDSLFENTLLEA
mgnify:FL=1